MLMRYGMHRMSNATHRMSNATHRMSNATHRMSNATHVHVTIGKRRVGVRLYEESHTCAYIFVRIERVMPRIYT